MDECAFHAKRFISIMDMLGFTQALKEISPKF
jgi:hypothetical protein